MEPTQVGPKHVHEWDEYLNCKCGATLNPPVTLTMEMVKSGIKIASQKREPLTAEELKGGKPIDTGPILRRRIYIAGPLNADNACDYLKNVAKMTDQAEIIRRAGFAVFNPALDLLAGIKTGTHEYYDYFDNNSAWIPGAEAVYLCPGVERSAGAQKEIDIAEQHGIPIFKTLQELIDWAYPAKVNLEIGGPRHHD